MGEDAPDIIPTITAYMEQLAEVINSSVKGTEEALKMLYDMFNENPDDFDYVMQSIHCCRLLSMHVGAW